MRAINRSASLGCVLALALVGGVIGCGSAEQTARSEVAHARAYTVEHLKARLGSFAWLSPRYRSASDLLDNVRFAEGDRKPQALTQAVVVGRISAVEPGVGFAPPESGVEGRRFHD